jgi:hypothetical protein
MSSYPGDERYAAEASERTRKAMSDTTDHAALARLVEKWENDAEGVDAMGYSQQADRIRACADDLTAALSRASQAAPACTVVELRGEHPEIPVSAMCIVNGCQHKAAPAAPSARHAYIEGYAAGACHFGGAATETPAILRAPCEYEIWLGEQAAPAAPTTEAGMVRVLLEVDIQTFQHGCEAGTQAVIDTLNGRECEANNGPAMVLVRSVRVVQPAPPPAAPSGEPTPPFDACPTCNGAGMVAWPSGEPARADLAWAISRCEVLRDSLLQDSAAHGPAVIRGRGYPNQLFSEAQDGLALRILLAAHPSPAVPPPWSEPSGCAWRQSITRDGYQRVDTACGYGHEDIDLTGLVFCAHCGGRIALQPPPPAAPPASEATETP